MNKRIAIQGYEGSFHQVAAQQFFGKDVEVICCSTFKELVKIAEHKKESNGGIMAIENSIAGSILPNYNLLQKRQKWEFYKLPKLIDLSNAERSGAPI